MRIAVFDRLLNNFDDLILSLTFRSFNRFLKANFNVIRNVTIWGYFKTRNCLQQIIEITRMKTFTYINQSPFTFRLVYKSKLNWLQIIYQFIGLNFTFEWAKTICLCYLAAFILSDFLFGRLTMIQQITRTQWWISARKMCNVCI